MTIEKPVYRMTLVPASDEAMWAEYHDFANSAEGAVATMPDGLHDFYDDIADALASLLPKDGHVSSVRIVMRRFPDSLIVVEREA